MPPACSTPCRACRPTKSCCKASALVPVPEAQLLLLSNQAPLVGSTSVAVRFVRGGFAASVRNQASRGADISSWAVVLTGKLTMCRSSEPRSQELAAHRAHHAQYHCPRSQERYVHFGAWAACMPCCGLGLAVTPATAQRLEQVSQAHCRKPPPYALPNCADTAQLPAVEQGQLHP